MPCQSRAAGPASGEARWIALTRNQAVTPRRNAVLVTRWAVTRPRGDRPARARTLQFGGGPPC